MGVPTKTADPVIRFCTLERTRSGAYRPGSGGVVVTAKEWEAISSAVESYFETSRKPPTGP
jgi:hypothetical protein